MRIYNKELNFDDGFLSDVKAQCLTWAREVAQTYKETGERTHPHLTFRPRSFHAVDRTPWDEWDKVVNQFGAEKAREWKRRQIKMLREFGEVSRIIIDQYDLPEDMRQYIKEQTYLEFGIPKDESLPVVQIQDGGELLHPHRGHARLASFFCLLEGEGEVTKWYDETTPFEHYPEYYIPDMAKLKVAEEKSLTPNVWTLFNHEIWHSVHRDGDLGVRINFGIDFKTMNVNQAMEYLT